MNNIVVTLKPHDVSWDAIKDCLYNAHAVNRANGVLMKRYLSPAEELRDFVGQDGFCWVALDGHKVVGTACLKIVDGKEFYNEHKSGYLCFASVLPEYSGLGLFKKLEFCRESKAKEIGLVSLFGDTNAKNRKRLSYAKKNGYCYVSYKRYGDHFSIVYTKWVDKCPYNKIWIKYKYLSTKTKVLARYKALKVYGIVVTALNYYRQ